MYNSYRNRIVTGLARENEMSFKIIDELVNSQYYFLKEKMEGSNREKGIFPTVRVFKLGVFYVTEGRKKYFREKGLENGTK